MANWALTDVMLLLGGGFLAAVCLLAGFLLNQYLVRRAPSTDRVDQVSDMMHRLYEWTHGMASEMAEYQEVVDGLAQEMDEEQTALSGTPHPVGKLVDANRRLRERLDSAEETLREQSEELEAVVTQAHTDSLTGLPNRRSFDAELDRRLAEFRRKGTPLSILLIDVDHFKNFNDQYGHLVGDRVLRLVAQTLQESTRDSDLATRFGGEEFAVILPDTSGEVANHAAERVRVAIETNEMLIDRQTLKMTVSGGVTFAQQGDVLATLIERADVALYRAKESGRNCTFWHDGFLAHPTLEPATIPGEVDENFSEICNALRQRLLEVSTPLKRS
jgi:diguanylate cyclase